MGTKEDAVRERQAENAREAAESKARGERAATKEAELASKAYDEKLSQIDAEAKRIATLLENADWSLAELRRFGWSKKHWWSKAHAIEFACLAFASFRYECEKYRIYMRSDGALLLLVYYSARLMTPAEFYERPKRRDSHTFKDLDVLIEFLQSITSLGGRML